MPPHGRKSVTIDERRNKIISNAGGKLPDIRSNSVPLKMNSSSLGSQLLGETTGSSAAGPLISRSRRGESAGRSGSPLPTYSPRREGCGPYNALGLRTTVPRTYQVDFSYMDFERVEGMQECEPRSGTAVKRKRKVEELPIQAQISEEDAKKEKKKASGVSSSTLFFGGGQGKTHKTEDGFMVMRAKEETYAFKDAGDDPLFGDKDMKDYHLNADGVLVKRSGADRDAKLQAQSESEAAIYHCTNMRLNNNFLTSIDTLVPVLYTVVWKPFLNLTILDLSCNEISSLPFGASPMDADRTTNSKSSSNQSVASQQQQQEESNVASLAELPLHTLLLHQNKLTDLKEVLKLQCLHKTLKKLTLNGNPIQTSLKKYKWVVLHHLPFLTNFDDCRITMKDREKMDQFEKMHVKKAERGSTMKLLPELAPRSQSALGVLGEYF